MTSRVPQLDQERLKHDWGRSQADIDERFRRLPFAFLERWLSRGGRVTTATTRPGLKFGELVKVDSQGGDVRLYLPRATPSDAGKRVQFVKMFEDSLCELVPTDGSLINLESRLEGIAPVGHYEAWWDGSAWWTPGVSGSASAAPRGALRQHGTEHNPIGLWQLDGNLSDTSGSGYTLTVESGTSGTERYTYIENLLGFHFDGSTALIYNTAEAALRITGDITFECIWVLDQIPTVAGTSAWFSHEPNPGAIGENENQNVLYSASINTYPSMHWFHEYGTGNDHAPVQSTYSCPSVGQVVHMAVVRDDAAKTAQFYFEGRAHGTALTYANSATGGSLGRLRLGAYPSAAARSKVVMASAKLIASALTADQIAAEYNRTVGPSHGFI